MIPELRNVDLVQCHINQRQNGLTQSVHLLMFFIDPFECLLTHTSDVAKLAASVPFTVTLPYRNAAKPTMPREHAVISQRTTRVAVDLYVVAMLQTAVTFFGARAESREDRAVRGGTSILSCIVSGSAGVKTTMISRIPH